MGTQGDSSDHAQVEDAFTFAPETDAAPAPKPATPPAKKGFFDKLADAIFGKR